ncbi:esterase/lipase family protein [Dyadobacter tibetensis]|uniref:esterase/lipase family protein n=1 Tax=Dyadobacter tibetensis TaxID=1211851 RepID=UPI000470D44C|nr:hypothetical protein [Dyadobacter tibetensis]
MKNVLCFVLFLSIIEASTNANAQHTKNLYFVHGLGGNSFSFTDFAGAISYGAPDYPSRKANVFSDIIYSDGQQYGLQACADRVKEQIFTKPNAASFGANSFIIAHSQGGIVSRKADQLIQYSGVPRTFGGIVTIGSPHGGAQIINNRDSKLFPLANNACNKLLKVEIQSTLQEAPLLKGLFWPVAKRISENFSNSLCDFVVPNDANRFSVVDIVAGHFTSAVANSYMVGSSELNDLNTFHQNNTSNIQKVAFYGNKDPNDVFWRVLHYFRNDPNEEPTFGATNDYQGVVDGQKILMDYKAARQSQEFALFVHCSNHSLLFWCIGAWPYKDRISALSDAINFLENINSKWLDVIGAASITNTTTNTCYYTPIDGNGYPQISSAQPCPEIAGYTLTQSYTVTTTTNSLKPSDGVVLVESQKAFPGVSAANQVELPNNSHMQERNSPELKYRSRELFDGLHGVFFKLDAQ